MQEARIVVHACYAYAVVVHMYFNLFFVLFFTEHQEHHFLAFVKQVERSNFFIFIYYLKFLVTLSNRKFSLLCHGK
jgi:hypothetical protein